MKLREYCVIGQYISDGLLCIDDVLAQSPAQAVRSARGLRSAKEWEPLAVLRGHHANYGLNIAWKKGYLSPLSKAHP